MKDEWNIAAGLSRGANVPDHAAAVGGESVLNALYNCSPQRSERGRSNELEGNADGHAHPLVPRVVGDDGAGRTGGSQGVVSARVEQARPYK